MTIYTYTPNTPQKTQKISDTQPLILSDFEFLPVLIGTEHSFTATIDNADPLRNGGTHLRCSMPNQLDPAALPTGTDGMYYVGGGLPKFYNGSVSSFMTTNTTNSFVVTGTTLVGVGATPLYTFPNNSSGTYYISSFDGSGLSATGTVTMDLASMSRQGIQNAGINASGTGTNVLSAAIAAGTKTLRWVIQVNVP